MKLNQENSKLPRSLILPNALLLFMRSLAQGLMRVKSKEWAKELKLTDNKGL